MQTAFCEIVFYLNNNNSPTVTNYKKRRLGLFSIHFTSQGKYANIMVRKASMKGEIGLKTAWRKMRQRQEEGG